MTPKIFIFEGVDYTGKTSCVKYVKEALEKQYPGKVRAYRNPGGTALGEKVRDIARVETNDVEEQLLAYLLAITSVRNAVKLDIANGCVVLLDRWVQSTWAYQLPDLNPMLQLHYAALLADKLDWKHTELIHFALGYDAMTSRMNLSKAQKGDTQDRFELSENDYRYKVWCRYQKLTMETDNFSQNQTMVYSAEHTLEAQQEHVLNIILSKLETT